MASKNLSKAFRSPLARQLSAPASQRRTFVSALSKARTSAPVASRAVARTSTQQVRGLKTVDFAGQKEQVWGQSHISLLHDSANSDVEREDWPREKLLEYFKDDTLAIIGYGSQGHGQGLNLRDNGINVIIGVRKDGGSWKEAQQDGWIPGTNLFEVDEAISKGTIVMNLLSDAAQSETWPRIKPQLTKGKVSMALLSSLNNH